MRMRSDAVIARLTLASAILVAAPLRAEFQFFRLDTFSERPAAAVENLGSVGRGDSITTRFRLRNMGLAAAPVRVLEVAGAGYSLASPVTLPQTVSPGAAIEFSVVFRAASDGVFSAALRPSTACSAS